MRKRKKKKKIQKKSLPNQITFLIKKKKKKWEQKPELNYNLFIGGPLKTKLALKFN